MITTLSFLRTFLKNLEHASPENKTSVLTVPFIPPKFAARGLCQMSACSSDDKRLWARANNESVVDSNCAHVEDATLPFRLAWLLSIYSVEYKSLI